MNTKSCTEAWITSLVSAIVVICFSLALVKGVQGCPPIPQTESEQKQDSPTKKQPVKVDLQLKKDLATPYQTLRTFNNAMEKRDFQTALKCLTLPDSFDATTRETKARAIADKLHLLLKNIFVLNMFIVPDLEDAISPHVLSGDLVSSDEELEAQAELLYLEKGEDGLWRFSAETVRAVDEKIWPQWSDKIEATEVAASVPVWIESLFPASFKTTHFLLPTYQWICLLILIAAGFVIDIIVRNLLNAITNFWFRIFKADVDYKAKRNLWKPVGLLTQSLVWYVGATLIDLPAGFLAVLLVAFKFFAVVSAIWIAFRAIDLLKSFLERRAAKTKSKYDDLLVPFVSTSLKFLAVCAGIILFVDVFEGPWKTVWGGLGIGGVAVAIAAKDVLGNFFGSVTVLTDRPFEIGDWVVIDKYEGTVEAVGLRSSKIRTFYNSVVVMPNSLLTTAVVDNMGKRHFRRFKTMIGVQYDTTPDQIDAFCEGIRELIRNQKHTRKDYFLVHLNAFSASSMDILLYCFFRCPDWDTELQQRHQLMVDIVRLAKQLNVEFAFPTQTIHYYNEQKSDVSEPETLPPPDWGRSAAQNVIDGGQLPGP